MAVQVSRAQWRGVVAAAVLVAGIGGATLLARAQVGATAGANVHVTPIEQPSTQVDAGIALAAGDASAVRVASAPGAWGGVRTGNEVTLSDRVASYRIAATLDPIKHVIDGKEQLTWRNRSAVPVRSVYMHMYMNAFESNDTTFFTEKRLTGRSFPSGAEIRDGEWGHIALRSVLQSGARASWSFVQPDGGNPRDHTVLKLDLPAPVAPGASTVLDIDFQTQLPRVVARTGYFKTFHLVAQWFPKIAVLELPGERGATAPRWNAHEFHLDSEFYADFGSYDVTLTLPDNYVVGATGVAQGKPAASKPGLLTHRYVQDDVHDFAWTADTRTAPPLVGSWTGPGSPPVTLTVLYPPEYQASAAPALKAAQDALTYFSRTLGPYPYRTVTIVVPPFNAEEAGGMEYPTFFTTEAYADTTPGTLNAHLLDAVTIHEFGHGYFYGILASNEFEEPLLDEGMNDFWDARMLRARKQDIVATTPLLKAAGFAPRFTVFDAERWDTPRDQPADAPGENAHHRLQGIGPVYTRTATAMRDLEAQLGHDVMERAFKEYYRRWKFRHPSLADLRDTIIDVSGQPAVVNAMFDQQLYNVRRIDDRIADFSSIESLPLAGTTETHGSWRELGATKLVQHIDAARAAWRKKHPKASDGSGPFPYLTTVTLRRAGAPVPQTLLVKFADGSSETVAWRADEDWHTFHWTKPVRAVSAQLDPERLHYLDVNKLDDARAIDADPRAARRWASDFGAIVQFLLSLIATA
ncbi:M1 family metallopeptidase [Massilia sp. S19_KUP03_FR1]|uniref:M1 family metallopeptidase n=1 Tax=Massilia sp. S19_KUP03_FR1 TaxID=3025503 RepID=UPI002FCCBDD7